MGMAVVSSAADAVAGGWLLVGAEVGWSVGVGAEQPTEASARAAARQKGRLIWRVGAARSLAITAAIGSSALATFSCLVESDCAVPRQSGGRAPNKPQ
jgi:hypothetical protein